MKKKIVTVSWLSGLLSAEIFYHHRWMGVQVPPLTAENIHFLRSGAKETALVMKSLIQNYIHIFPVKQSS